MVPGKVRTGLQASLVRRVQVLGGQRGAAVVAEKLFSNATEGGRIVGLALALTDPQRQHIDVALSGIADRRSRFEQYYALLLAQKLLPTLDPGSGVQLRSAIETHMSEMTEKGGRWSLGQSS